MLKMGAMATFQEVVPSCSGLDGVPNWTCKVMTLEAGQGWPCKTYPCDATTKEKVTAVTTIAAFFATPKNARFSFWGRGCQGVACLRACIISIKAKIMREPG